MALTIKRSFTAALLIAALLVAALFGSFARVSQNSLSHQFGAAYGVHQLVWYCPAPPVTC